MFQKYEMMYSITQCISQITHHIYWLLATVDMSVLSVGQLQVYYTQMTLI